jgi:ribonuclease Y
MDSTSAAALAGGAALAALGAALWVQSRVRQAALDERRRIVDEEKSAHDARRTELDRREAALTTSEKDINAALQRAAGMTAEDAKAAVIEQVRAEAIKEGEDQLRLIREEVEAKARRSLATVMERMSAASATESTTTIVPLPSEEMKGRLIGREGRNIRAFEQATGVDLVIDETPEAVVLSSFDPVRREAARITLVNLILDGRIHPQRIEELHAQAMTELQRVQKEAGKKAADDAGVSGLSAPVLDILGGLQFRTSYAQNVLAHSVETAILCGLLAQEIGADESSARRAGLLHDIGKALGPEWEGSHALAGMNFLQKNKEREPVLNAVGAHHHEIEPASTIAFLVIVADSLSASRPGARRESLERYIKRIEELEKIAKEHKGVERAFALHAGREIRVLVHPEQVTDENARDMARRIARQISQNSEFSGQIKVTVIRETRATEITP